MLSFSLSLLMSVFLLSLNVNGLRDPTKGGGLLHWLRAFPSLPDFVCLQETHCASVAECSSWFLSSCYSFVSSPGSVKSCGCILLFRTRFTLVRSFCDAEGRFLCGEFSFSDQVFRVACFYAPNRNPARNDFFEDVADRLDPTVPTIVCGDFNTGPRWLRRCWHPPGEYGGSLPLVRFRVRHRHLAVSTPRCFCFHLEQMERQYFVSDRHGWRAFFVGSVGGRSYHLPLPVFGSLCRHRVGLRPGCRPSWPRTLETQHLHPPGPGLRRSHHRFLASVALDTGTLFISVQMVGEGEIKN